jgi:hypothetical protein
LEFSIYKYAFIERLEKIFCDASLWPSKYLKFSVSCIGKRIYQDEKEGEV